LCPNFNSSCALFLRNTNCQIDPKISVQILQQTLFAVKTCKKFHKNRLPIIRDTWGAKVPNIIYASDSNDEEFETIVFTEARNQCLKAGYNCSSIKLLEKTVNGKEVNAYWKNNIFLFFCHQFECCFRDIFNILSF